MRHFSVLSFISAISMEEIPLFLMASERAYREGLANTLRMLLALWLQCLHILLFFVHNINFPGVKDRKQMVVGIFWLSPFPTWRMHPYKTESYQKVTRFFPGRTPNAANWQYLLWLHCVTFRTEGILPGTAEAKSPQWLPGRVILLFIMRVFLRLASENMSMVFQKLFLKASVRVQGCS